MIGLPERWWFRHDENDALQKRFNKHESKAHLKVQKPLLSSGRRYSFFLASNLNSCFGENPARQHTRRKSLASLSTAYHSHNQCTHAREH